MVELADIFRLHGSQYLAKFGDRMLPSHKKAMQDIGQCRTPALGGKVFACPEHPDQVEYSYHSCKNRACPKCQNGETTRWLEKQKENLLPVDYFLVTYTLPEPLREIARSNQKMIYDIFFKTSAKTFMELAGEKKHLGGKAGMMGILQTWANDMGYHVHIHYIVPGGALSFDGTKWLPHKYEDWFLPVKALSARFRKRLKQELQSRGFIDEVDSGVWSKDWVVHCEPVGKGIEVLKYVAPYVYRVAISNNRIESLDDGKVAFRFKDNTDQWQRRTLNAEEFIRRFLQHVLPKGFVKIRYYGFLAARHRKESLLNVRTLLDETPESPAAPQAESQPVNANGNEIHYCPICKRTMVLIREFYRNVYWERAPPDGRVNE